MDTFHDLLSFLALPLEEKFQFVPAARVAPVDFDLVSGHLRTSYPLHFLISLAADVFATESYQPPGLRERSVERFDHLLGLMHLMLWCRDERIWDPRMSQSGILPFEAIWSLLQRQALLVTSDLGLCIAPPSATYDTWLRDWSGEVTH